MVYLAILVALVFRPRMRTLALDIGNVIAAFSEEHVERLTGFSKGRLRYWDKTGFFSPSYVEENVKAPFTRFYSFRDVVALRTLAMLRVKKKVPLQHLRKVAKELKHLRDDLWTKTTLHVLNRKVVIVNPETGAPQEALSGQYVMSISLEDVVQDIGRDVAALSKRDPDDIGKIVRVRSICHNAPTIAGTRIPVGSIKRLYEDGYSVDAIVGEYPDLTHEDVSAALKYKPPEAA